MTKDDSSFEANWRRRFDEFAETQNTDASIAGWSESGLATRVRGFLRHWRRHTAGETWLDLGCGAGTYSRLLATQGLEVVGADYSLRTLLKATQRNGQPVRWVNADARRLPFRDSTYDGILCFGITQALSETLPVAAEAARILKPGGELWIDALNAACIVNAASIFVRGARKLPVRLRYDRVGRVLDALRAAGFESVEVYWLPIAPSGWQRTQRWLEGLIDHTFVRGLPFLCSLLSHSFIVRACR